MSVPDIPEGDILHAAAAAPAVGIDALSPPGALLIVTPHPDDETLGCGMALASAAAAGRRIAILLLTDGENSHPNSQQYPRSSRIALRQDELRHALHALAPDTEIVLERAGLTDGGSEDEAACPQFIDHTLRFARTFDPAAIWSTWGGDPHCDHKAAARIAQAIARDLAIPFWSFAVWGRFGEANVPANLHRFDDEGVRAAKSAALASYRSQLTALIADDPQGFVMPPLLAEHFRTHAEVFIRE